jgi:hypothetical protein
MRTNTRRLYCLLAAATMLLATPSLRATTITPGQTGVLPTDFGTVSSTTPVLEMVSGTFSLDGGALTGGYVEGVAVDPFGVTCTGCLDFFFQVGEDSTSTDSIIRIGLDGLFPSFSDNVGYATESGGTEVAPTSASFGTSLPAAPISEFLTLNPGGTSDILVIATNATSYASNGNLGFTASNESTLVAPPVIGGMLTPIMAPEPGTIDLLTTSLLCLLGWIYRRKRSDRSTDPVAGSY